MSYIAENGIKAVCFDIDGTLYPKWETDWILFKTSFLHLPFALRYLKMRDTIRREDGYDDFPLITADEFKMRELEIMYPRKNKSLEWFKEKEKRVFHDRWEKEFLSIRMYDGMASFLSDLAKVVPVALLSDFPIGSKLKALRIEGVASYVISSEDIGRLKPSKLPFRLLYEHFDLRPEEVLYVGDSERKDVLGSKKAGMKSLLITKDKKKALRSSADIVVSSYKEMREKLL